MKIRDMLIFACSFLILANLIDMLTTYFIIDACGIECEANPIAVWAFEQIGFQLGVIIPKLAIMAAYSIALIVFLFISDDRWSKYEAKHMNVLRFIMIISIIDVFSYSILIVNNVYVFISTLLL